MATVAVLIDPTASSRTNAELITLARSLGTPVAIATAGDVDADALGRAGATAVHAPDRALVGVQEAARHVADRVRDLQPAALLCPNTIDATEIAAIVAVECAAGIVTNAGSIDADFTCHVAVFGGSTNVTTRAKGMLVATVRPGAAEATDAPTACAVSVHGAVATGAAARISVGDLRPAEQSARPDLASADIVVSGGRGVGSPDGFRVIEAFADRLGAAVGSSRAAVEAGWYPHAFQVGQTGTTVSPQLYVAAGISGAIQHRAGMQTSKRIIAVNKDPEAPMFDIADLGVVGDLFEVLPATLELLGEE